MKNGDLIRELQKYDPEAEVKVHADAMVDDDIELLMDRQQLKHKVWLSVAAQMASLGTCCRLSVGCVLLRPDGSVAGTGYNGSLPGQPHCDPATCNPSARCYRTRHAERSALDYSQGEVATAYVTHEPCINCTKDLIARGCRRVYFLEPYAAKDEAENEAKRQHIMEADLAWMQMHPTGEAAFWQAYVVYFTFGPGLDDAVWDADNHSIADTVDKATIYVNAAEANRLAKLHSGKVLPIKANYKGWIR